MVAFQFDTFVGERLLLKIPLRPISFDMTVMCQIVKWANNSYNYDTIEKEWMNKCNGFCDKLNVLSQTDE